MYSAPNGLKEKKKVKEAGCLPSFALCRPKNVLRKAFSPAAASKQKKQLLIHLLLLCCISLLFGFFKYHKRRALADNISPLLLRVSESCTKNGKDRGTEKKQKASKRESDDALLVGDVGRFHGLVT